MPIYTDAPELARALLNPAIASRLVARRACDAPEPPYVAPFFAGSGPRHSAAVRLPGLVQHVVISRVALGSQYQRLIDLVRGGVELPHGLVCVAGTGAGFQGFRGRSWAGSAGNIHVSVHLAPGRDIERFETAFMALATVSVVETIDSIPGLSGRAGIKWVNDVLLGEAKVAGLLAHTQTRGPTVTSVVLGIGLNVETAPDVPPTPFVPAVACLRDAAAVAGASTLPALPATLSTLMAALERNYGLLLRDGYRKLVDRYRARSAVLGEHVLISSDELDGVPRILAEGRVAAIGDGLELRLEGRDAPITRGRLILPRAGYSAEAADRPDLRAALPALPARA